MAHMKRLGFLINNLISHGYWIHFLRKAIYYGLQFWLNTHPIREIEEFHSVRPQLWLSIQFTINSVEFSSSLTPSRFSSPPTSLRLSQSKILLSTFSLRVFRLVFSKVTKASQFSSEFLTYTTLAIKWWFVWLTVHVSGGIPITKI